MVKIYKHILRILFVTLILVFGADSFSCRAMEEEDAPSPSVSISSSQDAPQVDGSIQPLSRVLCIDGQGRRVISALYQLAVLERLKKKSTHELFDVISGVGSGAVAAILLTCKINGKIFSALEVLQLFVEFDKTFYTDNYFDLLVGEGKFTKNNFAKRAMVLVYSPVQNSYLLLDSHQTDSNIEDDSSFSIDPIPLKDVLVMASASQVLRKPSELTLTSMLTAGIIEGNAPKVATLVTRRLIGDYLMKNTPGNARSVAEAYTPNVAGLVTQELMGKSKNFDVISFGTGACQVALDPYSAMCSCVDRQMLKFVELCRAHPLLGGPQRYIRFQISKSALEIDTDEDACKLLSEGFAMLNQPVFRELAQVFQLKGLTAEDQVSLDYTLKSALKLINFESQTELYFRCILDSFLLLDRAKQQTYFQDRKLLPFSVKGDLDRPGIKIPIESLGSLILWIEGMHLFTLEHNESKKSISWLKNQIIEGSHDRLLSHLNQLRREVQTHYMLSRAPTANDGLNYLKVTSGIDIEDCSTDAASRLMKRFFRDNQTVIDKSYFLKKFHIDEGLNQFKLQFVEACREQINRWFNAMTQFFSQYNKDGLTTVERNLFLALEGQLTGFNPN